MKILVAPNAFKGSLTALEAAAAMAAGARRAAPKSAVKCVPVADGGDGLVEVLAQVLEGEIRSAPVTGPRGRTVEARFCWIRKRSLAVIEMAEASGLSLLETHEQDPCLTSTVGTGELIMEALRLGALHLIVGIGGSATCDGGAGMAHALGVRFFDNKGRRIHPTGGVLQRIHRIDMQGLAPAVPTIRIDAICDVDNPLLGEQGAARIYGPQKGATPQQVELLERGLEHLALVIKRDVGVEIRNLPGSGAAGGLGAGLKAFLGAALKPGIEVIFDLLDLEKAMEGADLVLTGEGCLDAQTLSGKAPAGVAALARKQGCPCLVMAGSVTMDAGMMGLAGFSAAYALNHGSMDLKETMTRAASLLEAVTEQAVRDFLAHGAPS